MGGWIDLKKKTTSHQDVAQHAQIYRLNPGRGLEAGER